MRNLLFAALTVIAVGSFAAAPAFADQGGTPNDKSSKSMGDSNAHGANGSNSGNRSDGDNGTDTSPNGEKGNDGNPVEELLVDDAETE